MLDQSWIVVYSNFGVQTYIGTIIANDNAGILAVITFQYPYFVYANYGSLSKWMSSGSVNEKNLRLSSNEDSFILIGNEGDSSSPLNIHSSTNGKDWNLVGQLSFASYNGFHVQGDHIYFVGNKGLLAYAELSPFCWHFFNKGQFYGQFSKVVYSHLWSKFYATTDLNFFASKFHLHYVLHVHVFL